MNTRELYKESERLTTFQRWSYFMDKTTLALTGFYYTGVEDRVKCYFCGVEVSHWEEGDTVLGEHKRWSSNCPLLCRNETTNEPLNLDLLNSALNSIADIEPSYDQLPPLSAGNDYTIENMRLKSFDGCKDGTFHQSYESLSDAGFYYTGSEDAVRCFSCAGGLKSWTPQDVPWEEHARLYPTCNYLNLVKGPKYVDSIKNNVNNGPKNVCNSTVQETTMQCKICLTEDLNTVILPCMHVVSCAKCSFSLSTCPICRGYIEEVKRIYFS